MSPCPSWTRPFRSLFAEHSGKKFPRLWRAEVASTFACGGPRRAIFLALIFDAHLWSPAQQAAAAAVAATDPGARPHPPRSRPRQCHVRQQPGGQERRGAAMECAPRSILIDSFSAAASMASTAIKAAGGVKPLPCRAVCVCACCVCRPDLPAAAPSVPLGTQNV